MLIPDTSHEKHDLRLKQYFREPRIRPMGIGLELVAKRKDNSKFPIEISLSFLETEAGRIAIGFLTDISSRKKVESNLLKRTLELDKYAHNVAHDLNTSLSGVIGYSELLLDTDDDILNSEKEEYLRNIAQSGKNMAGIIKEFLIFACMKKEDIKVEKVDMNSIIESALERLKSQIEESSTIINVQTNMNNCIGYNSWIEEALYNYISNAIKFGGNPPKVEIYSEKLDNGFVKYSVSDNGNGIEPDLMQKIFRNDKNNFSQGFGLGLSIVKRIIEMLDGSVSFESELGKGSIFSFSLK